MGSRLIEKDPDMRKAESRRRGRQDEMDGWHHRLNGHEQTREDRQGQGSLLCCSPWSKESDATEGLNNKEESRSKIEH